MHTARFSGALGPDRMHQQVGPYRIEVLEPLQRVRVVCDGDDHGVGFDLTWEGSFPAVEEEPHVISNGLPHHPAELAVRADGYLDAVRCASTARPSRSTRRPGSAAATARGASARWATPTRPGRTADDAGGGGGFWWLYVPLRFDDFQIIVMAQEKADGYRTLNDAKRVWADGRVEQLGWPPTTSGTARAPVIPEHATLHLTDMAGKPVTVEIDTLGFVPLHLGPGYGDADWAHGQWKGRELGGVGASSTSTTRRVVPRIPFGNIDHVAHAGATAPRVGACSSTPASARTPPTGFTDLMAVAP